MCQERCNRRCCAIVLVATECCMLADQVYRNISIYATKSSRRDLAICTIIGKILQKRKSRESLTSAVISIYTLPLEYLLLNPIINTRAEGTYN